MKRTLRKLACLALLITAVWSISLQNAFAQRYIQVNPTPFHRFIVTWQALGHFLTANFSEGSGYPYNYAYQPFPAQADIVVCPAGYNPSPGQGLYALHRWQVDQRPRIYYYYSIYYSSHGSNYRYQGVAGYVLAPNDYRGTPLHFWYSQSYGYYYTLNGEYPPGYTFSYHGVPFNLPVGGTYQCEQPPPPCEGMEEQIMECDSRGYPWYWDYGSCTCQYEQIDPCGGGRICYEYNGGEGQAEVPPM